MSEKFLSMTFFICTSSMFSGVAATMPKTVAPALAKRAALSEVFEHLAACCSQLTHGRHFYVFIDLDVFQVGFPVFNFPVVVFLFLHAGY